MKRVFIIIALLFSSITFVKAQTDYCKDIEITDDKTMSFINYYSPILQPLVVGANINRENHHKSTLLQFTVFNKTANYNAAGLYVIFTDGTIWKNESADIDCSYFDTDRGYSFGGADGIKTEDDYKMFETKKVKSIKVGTLELALSDEYATKFMAYVKCIHALK